MENTVAWLDEFAREKEAEVTIGRVSKGERGELLDRIPNGHWAVMLYWEDSRHPPVIVPQVIVDAPSLDAALAKAREKVEAL